MKKVLKTAWFALLLLVLPVLALGQEPVMLVDLPESAQIVENVEFENGDFIQTYQLENGVSVQLLRYTGFAMTLDELIASDWPLNSGVEMQAMTEISGFPAQHAHILQAYDENGYPVKADGGPGGVMAIDLIVVNTDGAALIFQSISKPGADDETMAAIIESLKIQGMEGAEVG